VVITNVLRVTGGQVKAVFRFSVTAESNESRCVSKMSEGDNELEICGCRYVEFFSGELLRLLVPSS